MHKGLPVSGWADPGVGGCVGAAGPAASPARADAPNLPRPASSVRGGVPTVPSTDMPSCPIQRPARTPRTAPRVCWNEADGPALARPPTPSVVAPPGACCCTAARPFPLVVMDREFAWAAFCASLSRRAARGAIAEDPRTQQDCRETGAAALKRCRSFKLTAL